MGSIRKVPFRPVRSIRAKMIARLEYAKGFLETVPAGQQIKLVSAASLRPQHQASELSSISKVHRDRQIRTSSGNFGSGTLQEVPRPLILAHAC